MACALSACNAHVKTFTAVPRHVCAGQPVDLEWSVVGAARVTVDPPSPSLPDGPVQDEGQATIAPMEKTRVELHVTRPLGNPTTSAQEIEVVGGAAEREVLAASLGDPAAAPGCKAGKVWATVHAKRFSSDMRVATVSSHPHDDRIYSVEHAGAHATVSPGTAVVAFEGTPLAGEWVLTAPVPAGQTCATVPPVLVIDVVTRCVPEAGR
jgi:hypothetical protein